MNMMKRYISVLNKFKNLQIIHNAQHPACVDCIYFSPEKNQPLTLGQCTKHGSKNLITGEIFYDYATVNRHGGICGVDGLNFIKKTPPNEEYGFYP